MNIESGYFLALVLVGFVLLVVALVAIFYKPGKRLNVNYNFKSDKDKLNKSIIEVFVENIGKKRVKMLFPYVKFSSTSSSKLFQLNSERVNCRFPKIIKKGEKLFKTRYGLIDMSCNHCHTLYPGTMIRGQKISQGMANGFPAYRLATGEIANLHLRIQQCMDLLRADPFATDSDEINLLGFYMMTRSNDLIIETPAVRY